MRCSRTIVLQSLVDAFPLCFTVGARLSVDGQYAHTWCIARTYRDLGGYLVAIVVSFEALTHEVFAD